MADNPIDIETLVPSKGLVMDYSELNGTKDMWVYARNVVINSQLGDIVQLQNEPATKFCVDFPYTYLGSAKLKNNRYLIFTGNNVDSEIGIFDELKCTYTTLKNDACLGFKTSNPIFAVAKENYDCTESVHWADGQLNELRVINIDKIPLQYIEQDDVCKTKEYFDQLDCNELAFTKKFNIPVIRATKTSFGNLKNGVYQLAIAYSSNGAKVTDAFSVTNPLAVWDHQGSGGSIELTIDNLDRDFNQYQLMLISTIDGVTSYQIVGEYNTSQSTHTITTNTNTSYINIPAEEITVKKTYYQKADYLNANDQYLFLGGVSTRPPLNYQKQALEIESYYEVIEVPVDFYQDNNDPGYYRNETYPFAIQPFYTDGEHADLYHIVGRKAKDSELQVVYGNDVFDSNVECTVEKPNRRFQIYNTADSEKPVATKTICNKRLVARGKMAYTESTDVYPDNVEMFGELACTPIRHHKFPDECKSARYRVDEKTGQVYLRILAVSFENIPHPLDENGAPVKDIAGFKIYRGDRANNRTVIARGMFSNVREYKDKTKTIKYTNYPFNYLGKDTLLSEKPVYQKAGGEKDFVALATYKTDEFTFFGPHAYFNRVGFGDYVNFESIETATVQGYFEETFKHPKAKLISDNVLYYAVLIGAIDGYLRAIAGSKCETSYKKGSLTTEVNAGTGGATTTNYSNMSQITRCNDILKSIGNIDAGASNAVSKGILKALGTVAKFGAFAFYAAETAQKVIETVYNFSAWKQYAIQYNAHGFFSKSTCIKPEQKRRRIEHYQYLSQELNSIQDKSDTYYNNLYKKDNVFVRVNKPIETIKGDTSHTTISKAKKCGEFKVDVNTQAKMYYGTIQRTIPNQYGQLDSIKYVSTGAEVIKAAKTPTPNTKYSISMVLGGDCYINRFSSNNPTDFFTHPLYDQPDGFVYDYRSFKAIANPRFWLDTSQYEFLDIVPKTASGSSTTSVKESNLPRQKYNLDCKNKKGFSAVNNQYFYTSVNAVMEYIVESDYNLEYRDWEKTPDFYTKNNNMSKLFENKGESRNFESFIYDKTYSKLNDIEKFYQQALDFSPLQCGNYDRNKIAYSLPAFKDQKFNNWLNFLPNNTFPFSQAEFGYLIAIKLIDNQQLIFLFDKASPYITPGRAELKSLSNETIYLGDGSIIREPRPLVTTNDNYGNCQSRFAFNQTKHGFFYPSQRKGNLFNYTGTLNEISRDGLYYFFDKYLPSLLLAQFPEFVDSDNPLVGVGLTSAYDPSFETYYLTKKDYSLKDEYIGKVTYDKNSNIFKFDNKVITLSDTTYFTDASWTISYSPSLKFFVSFHDYHPAAYINTENHFLSIINKDGKSSVHIHNDRCDLFCNYYGVDFPHSFTVPINNGQNVEILRNIEYQADTFLYKNNCMDKFHVLDTTYDKALIYNTEQITGYLNLTKKDKQKMSQLLKLDKDTVNPAKGGFDIYYDKSEQKFRFNHFHDITKDRGEYSGLSIPLLVTEPNGYKFAVNPDAIHYEKNIYQKKKIRHTHSKLHLERTVSGPHKHIFYLANIKQTNSPR